MCLCDNHLMDRTSDACWLQESVILQYNSHILILVSTCQGAMHRICTGLEKPGKSWNFVILKNNNQKKNNKKKIKLLVIKKE